MSVPLEDYGLIGDLHTAALVSREGAIDWLCLPRFDSGACFASLLGDEDNGRWVIRPVSPIRRTRRRYRGASLVLECEMETDDGIVRLIDLMPPRQDRPSLVRIVEGVRGRVPMRLDVTFRFDHGSVVPWVHRVDGGILAVAGPDAVTLITRLDLIGRDLRTRAHFDLGPGERVTAVMTWFPSHESVPAPVDAETALADTERFWADWTDHSEHPTAWHAAITRSLTILKALTYAPTGGIVAAPTTSLPERLGGVRNWDYRFCWLRDATLTLLTFLRSGHVEEAVAWRDWFLRAIGGAPGDLRIMYGVAGERRLEEAELPWLAGYAGSRPVRTGNDASAQLQLGVYGEIVDALYQGRKHGIAASPEAWSVARQLLDWLETGWRQEDSGIWEMRGPRRHFTHSKVMAWVAFDRAVRLAETFERSQPVDRWRRARDAIRAEVLRDGYDAQRRSFVQSYGSDRVDASALMFPLVGFLPATDPRMLDTVAAIERELLADGLVGRYRHDDGSTAVDGLPPGEGTFLPCSFWLVQVLAMQGRSDAALALFQRLLALANDLGLLSEEYDTANQRLVGNFPQALSHLALIDAAHALASGAPSRDGSSTQADPRGR